MTLHEQLWAIYSSRGAGAYFGEVVTTLEHSLQAAYFAQQSNAADALVVALNKLGHCAPTEFLATQLSHCDWQGVHFYDLIFPLFVFMMGISTVFRSHGSLKKKAWARRSNALYAALFCYLFWD